MTQNIQKIIDHNGTRYEITEVTQNINRRIVSIEDIDSQILSLQNQIKYLEASKLALEKPDSVVDLTIALDEIIPV